MEKELKHYKTATWILAIIAIVLAFWVIRLSDRDITSGLEAATATLQKCSDDLSAWRAANPNPVVASAAAQEELSNILKACAGDAGEPADDIVLPQ